MKKIIAILTIIMVFILPFSVTFNEQKAHANIISKPLTITAKKVAKELAQNSAVEMAEHILFEKAMADFLATDMTDPGYKAVCLDGAKSYEDCSPNKRAQVKETLTSTDESTLKNKVEQVLERKTNTSSKWTKFLDWFVPIFLISGLVASFDAMLDPDSEGLIDDIALEALTDSGFIKPLKATTEAVKLYDFTPFVQSAEVVPTVGNNNTDLLLKVYLKSGKSFKYTFMHTNIQYEKTATDFMSISVTYYGIPKEIKTSPVTYRAEAWVGGSFTINNSLYSSQFPNNVVYSGADFSTYAAAQTNAVQNISSQKMASIKTSDVNSIMNGYISAISDVTTFNFTVDTLKPPEVITDYGTQTGLQHIKNPDGTVKTPGIENFKYTYNNTFIYPSPDSTTGWKDKATDIDIAVVEDDVVVDDGAPPTDPEAPPGEDDDINTDKDKDKIKKKSRDWSVLLTTRFPFSLPWDFLHLMKFLYAEPMTPEWEIKGTEKVPFNLKLDLKFMEPYAPWFRTFIFLSFVMSVIFLHGRFMGGSK